MLYSSSVQNGGTRKGEQGHSKWECFPVVRGSLWSSQRCRGRLSGQATVGGHRTSQCRVHAALPWTKELCLQCEGVGITQGDGPAGGSVPLHCLSGSLNPCPVSALAVGSLLQREGFEPKHPGVIHLFLPYFPPRSWLRWFLGIVHQADPDQVSITPVPLAQTSPSAFSACRWLEMLIVYPRTNKQNQKKKRKVEPPTPQVTQGHTHTLSSSLLPPSQGHGHGVDPPQPSGSPTL